MKVLVIGSDTPSGQALCDYLEARGADYSALTKSDCRWKSERHAKKSLRRAESDFVVDLRLQAAADGGIRIHDVDIQRCLWLAKASQTQKIPLMLLSCARIFEGRESRAYREEDYPDGVSTMAGLLAAAESAVRDHCERHVILRLGPVFSASGINVLTYMLNELHDHGSLELSRRRRGCPIPAEDAARVVSGMLDQYGCGLEAWGIFHYCSPDATTCYEFAEVLLAAASQYTEFEEDDPTILVAEDAGDEFDYRLECAKIRDTFAIKQQPWRASVAACVKQFYAHYSKQEVAEGESHGQRDASA